MTEPVLLSIDLGKNLGFACVIGDEVLLRTHTIFEGLSWLKRTLKGYIDLYKPDVILIPYPTAYYNTLIAHAKMMGVICMVAEEREITVVEVNDSTCKKVVVRGGKVGKTSKKDTMDFFGLDNSEEADSLMFCRWF